MNATCSPYQKCKGGEFVRLLILNYFFELLFISFQHGCSAMEDAHTVVLNLEDGTDQKNTFFAVYDGHGGK